MAFALVTSSPTFPEEPVLETLNGLTAAGVEAKTFYDVEADVNAAAKFIRLYVTRNGRWLSPKYLIVYRSGHQIYVSDEPLKKLTGDVEGFFGAGKTRE